MALPSLPKPKVLTPTGDDVERQLQLQVRLKGIGRVLRKLGLMRLEDSEDIGLENFKVKMGEAPLDVLGGLRKIGRNPDSETFLRSLKPDIDDDGLKAIWGKSPVLPPVLPPPVLPPPVPPPPTQRVSPVSARVTAPFQMPSPIPEAELRPREARRFLSPEEQRLLGVEEEARSLLSVEEEERIRTFWGQQPIPPPILEKPLRAIGEAVESPAGQIATAVVGSILVGIGGAQAIQVLTPAARQAAGAIYSKTLGRSLDKMITRRAAGIPKEQFNAFQNAVYDWFAANKPAVQERARNRFLARLGRTPNVSQAMREAADDTAADVERVVTSLIPKGTQTGAMAQGGLPKPTVYSVAGKLADNVPLNAAERQLYASQSQAVEDILKGMQPQPVVSPQVTPQGVAKEPWMMTREEYKLANDIEEPSSYLYHGTPKKNLEGIRNRGLESKTRQRNDWEEGDRTPQEQELLYFERKENKNWGGKQGVQIRVNEDLLPRGVGIQEDALRPGEFYTFSYKNEPYDIPPEAIEYYDVKGKRWVPLADDDHTVAIRQALSEGKPVPSSVLADYPDLAEQAKVTPAPEVAPRTLRMDVEAERARLLAKEVVTPAVQMGKTGRQVQAYGPDPSKPYQMQYRLIELDDLIPSHTDAFAPNPAYPKELQPRMRDRAASRLWVQQTAKNLSPEALTSDTKMLDTGLPIVGPDMVVESGNGRVMSMRRAQQEHPEVWAAYQKALRDSLSQYGLTEDALKQMRSPVIVRERLTEVDRVRFAQEANQPVVMGMSPLENAVQDATNIRLDNLYVPEETIGLDATLRLASNRDFVRDFLASIPANERAVLIDSVGDLNLQGVSRLKAALFAHTYPGPAGKRLTQIFFESRDPLIRNVEDGMMASLSKVARAEEMVRSGERQADLAITEDLAEALDRLSRLKQAKLTVTQYLGQVQMFERHLAPFQEQLLRYLDTIARSPKAIRQFLGDYADAVVASPNPKQITMMAMDKPTKEGILNGIIRREEEGPLFATAKAPEVAQPVRVEEDIGLPEAQARPARQAPQVQEVAPVAPKVEPPPPPPQPVVAEEVQAPIVAKPKVEAVAEPKPPTAKVARKTPTTPRQFVTALDDINTELEAWRASLKGLRKDNAAEARRAIKLLEAEVTNAKAIVSGVAPADVKAMRQKIMAAAHFKGISKTQTYTIFKRVTGKIGLTKMTQTQLAAVLKAIQEARPVRIKGKKVVTKATEQSIQTLKKTLIDGNYLNEQSYREIRASLRLQTDKYINANMFIGEKEAKELIRTMNSEAEVGLLKHQTEVAKALEDQPELRGVIGNIENRSTAEAALSVNKGVKVSPLWDMWVYTEKLQNRTGEPFYDVYRMMLDKKLENVTRAEDIFKEIIDSTPDFKTISRDKQALGRVNDYLAAKLGEKVKVSADMTEGEIALAKQIEKTLFSFQNSVRYNRFVTAYYTHEGDVTLIANDIPNAPREDLREAIKIYESGGATQLSAYLDTKDWGVIKSGYEPHIVVNPKLQLRRIKASILPKGMLKTREGIEFNAGEKTILDRTHTYVHRMLNLELEPYLKKLDRTLQKVSPKLRADSNTADHLSLMIDEMKGTFYINEPLARYIAKGGGYATSVVYLSPHLGFRNLFQNAAMNPDRSALVDPRNKKLTAEDIEYFDTYVNQGRQFLQQFLLQGELGTGSVANLLRRISFMGISESINNHWAFWSAVNKGNRALEGYQKTKDIGKFINDSGMKDLTLRQQKEVLELMALGKEKEAVRLIGRKINHNTNMIYDRAQGAPVTMGTSGRLLGSLLNFTRGYGQRLAQQLGKMTPGHTASEKRHAAKILIGLAIFGMATGWLYQKITGKKQNPYNPLLMLNWSPGGLAVGAMIDTADVIGNIIQAVTGNKDALDRIPTDLARSGDLLIPFYSVLLNVVESLSNTKYVDRLALRKVVALLKENYHPNEDFYRKERSWIGKLQHALFGGEPTEPLKIDEAKKVIPEYIASLGKIDQAGLDDALKRATIDKASPARIAEIKAKDWTYDITSLRRDISDAIRGLTDEEIAQLAPIAIAYSEFANQKDAYGDLSVKEQEQYLKDNPDFTTNRPFWGDLTTIPDLKTAKALAAKAEKHALDLDMIPAFQKTDKGKERIPSNRDLWQPYFDYNDLPGTSYLNFTREQVDAGELPEQYRQEWDQFQKLTTDRAQTAFKKARSKKGGAAYGGWRDDFRRANLEFDKWLQEHKGFKPLKKAGTRARANRRAQASSSPFSGGFRPSSRRRRVALPTFPKPSFAMGIGAPSAPRV